MPDFITTAAMQHYAVARTSTKRLMQMTNRYMRSVGYQNFGRRK